MNDTLSLDTAIESSRAEAAGLSAWLAEHTREGYLCKKCLREWPCAVRESVAPLAAASKAALDRHLEARAAMTAPTDAFAEVGAAVECTEDFVRRVIRAGNPYLGLKFGRPVDGEAARLCREAEATWAFRWQRWGARVWLAGLTRRWTPQRSRKAAGAQ